MISNVSTRINLIFQVTKGLFNATNFAFGGNRTECQFAQEISYTSVKESYEIYQTNKTYFGLLNALNHMGEVPVQFNKSVSSCYYSTKEIYTVYALYNASAHDMQNIKFNLFFNGGIILSSIKNIYFYYLDV